MADSSSDRPIASWLRETHHGFTQLTERCNQTTGAGAIMQRYLWQQADGQRHVYDTTNQHPARAGATFRALCGETVMVRTQDMVAGMWFDPECPVCTIALARALRWRDREITDLAGRLDWTHEDITRLATALGMSLTRTARLIGQAIPQTRVPADDLDTHTDHEVPTDV